MRLTFLGDIMAEPSTVRTARKRDGSYDFGYVFQHVKPILEQSDFVVGNLESPLATPEMGYSEDFADFGAPDSYVDALLKAGVNLVSTANNHSFDRKQAGLVHTIEVMDEKGLPHTGTFLPEQPRQEAAYFTVDGVKFAVIAYTYGTNFYASGKHCKLEGAYAHTVNMLRPQTESVFLPSALSRPGGTFWFDKLTKKWISYEVRGRIKRAFGIPHATCRIDHNLNTETMAPYVAQFQSDIRKAREKADVVIFYPHTGGQFATTPGAVTEYVVEKAVEAGADMVLASHAHAVQKAQMIDGVLRVYSLGNHNMDPHSGLVVPQSYPGVGLALHLYMEGKRLQKATFQILVTEKISPHRVAVPIDKLYASKKKEKDRKEIERTALWVYETVTRRKQTEDLIQSEYLLWEAQ